MSLPAGARLGVYEVVSLLGAGGMGEVYRARDPRLGRDVAIKVLPASVASDPERLARFEREARATAALNHPNIVAVFDVGNADGVTFVVSELLEGETLREALAYGAIPVRQAVDYAVQIAHGLAAAHEKGILHRDLKPENVFVTRDGRVKILDFGLAKLKEADSLAGTTLPTTPASTAVGQIVGTIGYMAPEQVRGAAVDHRADIFAFGAILYELLTGEAAFRRGSRADTISAILKEDPPQLADAAKVGSAALQRVVQRCLDKRRELRFHSAHDLAYAIEAASIQTSSGATASQPVAAASETIARRARGLAVAVALVLAVAAVAYVIWTRPAKRDYRLARFLVAAPAGSTLATSSFGTAEFSVSPDGQQIAVNLQTADSTRTWIRRIDEFEMKPVAGTEGVIGFPFWSPDGRSLGFVAGGKIKRVAVDGGAVQTICDAPTGSPAFSAVWGPDGTILVGGIGRPIQRVPAAGGTLEPVTKLSDGEQAHLYPTFLPDGRRFLFGVVSNRPGVHLASLEGGDARRVLNDALSASVVGDYLVYARDRAVVAQRVDTSSFSLIGEPATLADDVRMILLPARRLLFSTSAAGFTMAYQSGRVQARLVWFDRSGREIGPVGEAGNMVTLGLAHDGTRIAFGLADQQTGAVNLWVTDIARGVTTRLTSGALRESSPAWSPQGDQIAFHSFREDGKHLYVLPATGGEPRPLLRSSGPGLNLDDWSRDGRYILYHETETRQMLALELGGQGRKVLVARGVAAGSVMTALGTPDQGVFSPDGAFVAFNMGATGRPEVFLKRFPPTDQQWQISNAGGMQPRWRADGRELYYLAPDGAMMVVDITSQPPAFKASAPRRLFKTRINPVPGTEQYAVTGDGERFLIMDPVVDEQSLPLSVIVDWPALIERR